MIASLDNIFLITFDNMKIMEDKILTPSMGKNKIKGEKKRSKKSLMELSMKIPDGEFKGLSNILQPYEIHTRN
jgi:hypothetical protein